MKLTGGGRLSLSTAGMLVSTWLLFALPAFADDSSLPGQWENEDSSLKIVYLADGRVVKVDERPDVVTPIRVDMGTYTFDDTAITYTWMLEGSEKSSVVIGIDTMTDEMGRSMNRTATAEDAQAVYDESVAGILKTAALAVKDVPTAPVKLGPIKVGDFPPDPHPLDVVPKATVYSKQVTYRWSPPGPPLSTDIKPDEPGHTTCQYTFLPNGRFLFDAWVYGATVDGFVPLDPRLKIDALQGKTPIHHQQYWGKYEVTADAGELAPDRVDVTGDSGSTDRLSVVDGRLYLVTSQPRLLLVNEVRVAKYGQQALTPVK